MLADPITKCSMRETHDKYGVKEYVNTALQEVKENAFTVKLPDGTIEDLNFDLGFNCLGMRANNPILAQLEEAFDNTDTFIYPIGDSVRARPTAHHLISADMDNVLLGILDGLVRRCPVLHRNHLSWTYDPADNPRRLRVRAWRHVCELYYPRKLQLGLQVFGKLDVMGLYAASGDLYSTITAIIRTLPLAPMVLVLLAAAMIAFYATSFDAIVLLPPPTPTRT